MKPKGFICPLYYIHRSCQFWDFR